MGQRDLISEGGMWNAENKGIEQRAWGRGHGAWGKEYRAWDRGQIIEFGLRPVGAIGAYAPEGSGNELKSEFGRRNAESKGIEHGAESMTS
jgi:hypothetical protein